MTAQVAAQIKATKKTQQSVRLLGYCRDWLLPTWPDRSALSQRLSSDVFSFSSRVGPDCLSKVLIYNEHVPTPQVTVAVSVWSAICGVC